MSVPFTEWTREEKDEFAKRRMAEMKLLNEKYKQRHEEVEKDRMKAEAKNSSVTSVMAMTKEKAAVEDDCKEKADFASKPKGKEREWDKGKSSLDLEDWNEQPQYANWRNPDKRSDQRYNKNEDHWKFREAPNAFKDHQRFREFGKSWGKRNFPETNKSSSSYRNDNFSRQKDRGYNRERNYNASYTSFRDSNVRDSRKKTSMVASSRASRSSGDSEIEPRKQSSKIESDRMWRNGDLNEVRNRQMRVEKWVKSVNATGPLSPLKVEDDFTSTELKEAEYPAKYSLEYDPDFISKEVALKDRQDYNLGNDGCDLGNLGSKFQAHDNIARSSDKIYESKNENTRKGFSDKNKLRQDFDTSNRPSKEKESDYCGYKTQRGSKTYNSKSYDASGIWDDIDVKVDPYTDNNSWKDNNTPQSESNIFRNKENRKIDEVEFIPSTKIKHSNNGWKRKSHLRNLSSSDNSGTYENQSLRKPSDKKSNWQKPDNHALRKVKYGGSKLKTNLRPSSSSRNFKESSPLVDDCKWSSHELESDDSVKIVKIESHTIKRSAFNSSVGTDIERNRSPEVITLDDIESETDMATSINPIKASDNLQHKYTDGGTWSDCEYYDEKHPGDDQQMNLQPLTNVHSEIDDADCESYREADDSDYAYIKGTETEIKIFDVEAEKQDNLNADYLEEITSVENGNVVYDSNSKLNDNGIVNTESSSIQDIAVESNVKPIDAVKMAELTKTANILNPEVTNDEEVECLLEENAPYCEKNCTANEIHVDVACAVSEKMETSMEEAYEDSGSEISYNLEEYSDSNLSITHSEKESKHKKTSNKQRLETTNEKKAKNASQLTTPEAELPDCQNDNANNTLK